MDSCEDVGCLEGDRICVASSAMKAEIPRMTEDRYHSIAKKPVFETTVFSSSCCVLAYYREWGSRA